MKRNVADRYRIPSLSKACQALRLMADAGTTFTPSDLARQLSMPRTTAFRLLRTLVAEGLVEERPDGYRLGIGMLRLALRTLESIDVRGKSVPVLRELAKGSGETAHLAILAADKALLVEVCDSSNPLRVASRTGSLVDLHCSSTGKVLLAACDEPYRDSLIEAMKLERRTRNTITSHQELRRDLEKTVERGYGLDDEEYMEGVRCLAAPVRDIQGRVVAAIGITGATLRFTRGEIPRVAEMVIGAATQLSRDLGCASVSRG
jgi:IclR family acetate operon transcriptional repressor